MIFGMEPYSATIRIPENSPGELNKPCVIGLLEQAKEPPLPRGLPAGTFVRRNVHNRVFLFYKYSTHVQCSATTSETHKKLGSPIAASVSILDFYNHIGAGSNFVSGIDDTGLMWSVDSSGQAEVTNKCTLTGEDPVNVSEAQRTAALVTALQRYIDQNNIPVKVSQIMEKSTQNIVVGEMCISTETMAWS